MTTELFEKLLNSEESALLDFKKINYDIGTRDESEIAKYVKDIISFINTIREEFSYIIIGVEDNNGTKILHGLDKNFDEAHFQDKVKDKVNPRPIFRYYSFEYKSKRFGVFEFPLSQYSAPITPIVKMKGLEIGKVYSRRGSSNSEATHIEAIKLNEWITSVIPNHTKKQLINQISELIKNIQQSDYYSPYLSKALEIGKQTGDEKLIEFCTNELIGWSNTNKKFEWCHRNIFCFTSFNKIISAQYPEGTNISVMWNELEQNKDFWKGKFFLGDPISQIESQIKNYRLGPGNQFCTMPIKASELLDDTRYKEKDYALYMYWNENNLTNTYQASKQEFITLLISNFA